MVKVLRWSLLIVVSLLAVMAIAIVLMLPPTGDPQPIPERIAADHHMHIRSAAIARLLLPRCEGVNGFLMDCQQDSLQRDITGEELVALLDRNRVGQGVVLSMAYFSGMVEMGLNPEQQRQLTRAENTYIHQQVTAYPDRLAGFFSVNPIAPFAEEEVRYWAEQGGFKGLKLHMANSSVDLQDEAHLTALKRIFAVLDDYGLSALVHLRNRNPEYGYDDAKAFLLEVFAPTRNVHLTLGHFVGWGGYGEQTDNAAGAVAELLEAGVIDGERITFDLSATFLAEGGKYNPMAILFQLNGQLDSQLLVERIRSLGVERVVFGSDWNPDMKAALIDEPGRYAHALSRIGLNERELAIILTNTAPYLRRISEDS